MNEPTPLAPIPTTERTLRARLHASEERLRLVIEGTDDQAIFTVDPRGRIETWNEGARRLAGYLPSQAVGEHLSLLQTPREDGDLGPSLDGVLEAAAEVGGRRATSLRLRRQDGGWISCHLSVAATRDEHGAPTGFVVVLRDLTERISLSPRETEGPLVSLTQRRDAEATLRDIFRANEQLERQVEVRTAELARTVRLRADMLAFVSHDLRNPLSTISLGAEALRADLSSFGNAPTSSRTLRRISRAAAQMQSLIGGLLDFASIEAGTFSLHPQRVQIRAVVEHAVDAQATTAQAKAVTLELAAGGDGWVTCDADRVGQVLANLISNAIKFTNAGGKVALDLQKVDGACRIAVVDSGCGIAPDHLTHVFDRYWHAPALRQGGTGLGLAIARGIVEAHGGGIFVESTEGKGSHFHFTLGPMTDLDPARSRRATIPGGARQVLIVDDDPELRLSIAEFLVRKGFIVLEATDGAAAFEVLATETPDLILLDRQMPIMNGDEFLRAREGDAAALQIPVVMISASCPAALPGIVALIRKPFTSAGLLDVVNRHCRVRPAA